MIRRFGRFAIFQKGLDQKSFSSNAAAIHALKDAGFFVPKGEPLAEQRAARKTPKCKRLHFGVAFSLFVQKSKKKTIYFTKNPFSHLRFYRQNGRLQLFDRAVHEENCLIRRIRLSLYQEM